MNQQTIHDILAQREEFMVIGLTGRMGSGCSKVAQVLATSYDDMDFPHPVPQSGMESLDEEERVVRIIAEYAEAHWLKFDVIQVSAIIATFILEDDSRFMHDLKYGSGGGTEHGADFKKKLLEEIYRRTIALYIESSGKKNGISDSNFIVQAHKEENGSEAVVVGDTLWQAPSGVCVRKNLLDDAYVESQLKELKRLGKQLQRIVDEEDGVLTRYFRSEDYTVQYKALFSPSAKEEAASPDAAVSVWETVGDMMNYLYGEALKKHTRVHRRHFLECVDKLLVLFSSHSLMQLLQEVLQAEDPSEALWNCLRQINHAVTPGVQPDATVPQIRRFVFARYITTWFGRFLREYVTDLLGHDAYARLFQRYGQMIRFCSCIPAYGWDNTRQSGKGERQREGSRKKDIFAIPRTINEHIKVLRHPFRSKDHRPVRIVVDSIKNVFEAVYLRYRYSAFYLWAITTDSEIRQRRLHENHLTDIQVQMMDWNEYPDKGGEVIAAVNEILGNEDLTLDEEKHWEKIHKRLTARLQPAQIDFYLDSLAGDILSRKSGDRSAEQKAYFKEGEVFNKERRDFFTNNTYAFYTQDIDSCVCNADVYLFNNAESATDAENNSKLLVAVVRNVSLVMYPCLVRPTPVERCMQIAFSAKVNSGCLSRQVGAVVTDSQYNILAIGWNDVPCGEIPCAYKNLRDIAASADRDAYSDYELHNPDFRNRLKQYNVAEVDLHGLPCSYCFKNVHKQVKDPMRSRAMHAEEKALALCGREAEGGYLFTTSSPCEMCSKNAKNHKIRKIYFLEAYPGISQAQYTNSGDKDNRAELILFSGAVGRAYMQMYTPLLPHKDVLEYLGLKRILSETEIK